MVQEPFIDSSKRPDLTINLESRVGDITVRQLSEILGSAAAKSKELPSLAKEGKDPLKEDKDIKDHKDHKEPKDHKDQKDNKDHKDPKDQKDQKDQKDPKDHKDQKDLADQKASKDPKDQKDQKDQKDHKNEHKEQKDIKDHKDRKEDIIDKHSLPEATKGVGSPEGPAGASFVPSGLEELIHRLTRLEQDVADMKKGKSPS